MSSAESSVGLAQPCSSITIIGLPMCIEHRPIYFIKRRRKFAMLSPGPHRSEVWLAQRTGTTPQKKTNPYFNMGKKNQNNAETWCTTRVLNYESACLVQWRQSHRFSCINVTKTSSRLIIRVMNNKRWPPVNNQLRKGASLAIWHCAKWTY
jgi:hypothetical protein